MHRIAQITTSLAMVGILAIGLATYQSVQAAAPTAAASASVQIAIQNFAFSPRRSQSPWGRRSPGRTKTVPLIR